MLLIKETFESQSAFVRFVDECIAKIDNISYEGERRGYGLNKYGILKLVKSPINDYSVSDDKHL